MQSPLPPVSIALALPLLLVTTGCTEPDPAADGDTDEPTLTYYRDVQHLMTTHCGACHVDGGSGPFELATYEQLMATAPLVRTAVESGEMPPWSADPECRTFQHERRMSEADKETLLAWIDAGMPMGDPADATPVEPPKLDLDQVSVATWSALPYTPDASVADDYHCLVMDVEFDAPTYLSAYQVVPDAAGAVHHIIFYHVPPGGAPAMLDADAATQEAGYDCFGSSGFGGQPMGVWAPGGLPLRFPADSAYVIEPGSRIVAQMHYNTVVGSLGPDQTELHLAYSSAEPQMRVTMPILNGFFDIPAGDPAYVAEFSYPIEGDTPKQIFSVMPHMHLLGRSIDLRRERDGEETCVARIDDWDFHWQQFYDLETSDFIEVRAGDTLHYSCEFDNSVENQPIVDGQQQSPGPVTFGEGTLDEMCLHVVAMLEPFVADEPGPVCEGFDVCVDSSCAAGDGVCFLGCGSQSSDECGGCILQGIGGCGQSLCPSEAQAILGCLAMSCDADLSDVAAIQSCLANECQVEFAAEWACLEPHVLAGECNAYFSACGVEY
jgi:mono/diheme cytochrome c family protein